MTELRSGMTGLIRQSEKEGHSRQQKQNVQGSSAAGSMASGKFRNYSCFVESKTLHFSHLNL